MEFLYKRIEFGESCASCPGVLMICRGMSSMAASQSFFSEGSTLKTKLRQRNMNGGDCDLVGKTKTFELKFKTHFYG